MKRFERAALLALAATACGGGSQSVIPGLPRDGTANLPDLPRARHDRSDPWSGRRDLVELPPAVAPAPLGLPDPVRFKLANGMRVVVVEDKQVDLVVFELGIGAGTRDDPADKPGMAAFAAAVLARNGGKKARRFSSDLEASGGQLGAVAGFDLTSFSCAVAQGGLGTCIDLLPELAVRPSVGDKEVTTVRQDLQARLQQRREDPAQLGSAHLANMIWGEEHPGGRAVSARSLEAISRADLTAWHGRWFRPENAVLVVVGNASGKALKPRLEKAFAGWAKKKTPAHPAGAAPELSGMAVRLVDRPGEGEAQVLLGHAGVGMRDPDRLGGMLAAEVLGGGAAGRLARAAAKELGAESSAGAAFEADRAQGAFVASARAPADRATEATRLLTLEMARLADEGPTVEESGQAAARLAGKWAARLESTRELAAAVLTSEMGGGEFAELRDFGPRVFGISAEQVQAAARARLHPDRAVVVIVGPAEKIEPQLREAGWKYERVGADEPVSARERKALLSDDSAPQTAEQQKAARALLDKALAKKGGAAALRAVKSLRWKAKVRVELTGTSVNGELEKRYRAPDQLRLDMHLADLQIHATTVINSDQAWGREQGADGQDRTFELPASEAAAVRDQVWHDQDLVLSRVLEEGAVTRQLPDFVIDDVAHHAVELATADGGHRCTLYLDKKSLMLSGISFGAGSQKTDERFSDYRKVGNLMIAYKRQSKSPQLTLSAELSDAELNSKIDAALFEKPGDKGDK